MSKLTFNNSNNQFFISLKSSVDEYFKTAKIEKTGDYRLFLKTFVLIGSAITAYLLLMLITLMERQELVVLLHHSNVIGMIITLKHMQRVL
jgi:linoleoyl-CoA desaturase